MISTVITKLRKQHRWTQMELAKRLDSNQATIARWENGNDTPNEESVTRLARVFGVDESELLMPEISKIELEKFQEKFSQLTLSRKRMIIRLTEELSKIK